jgi:hypothetical protein
MDQNYSINQRWIASEAFVSHNNRPRFLGHKQVIAKHFGYIEVFASIGFSEHENYLFVETYFDNGVGSFSALRRDALEILGNYFIAFHFLYIKQSMVYIVDKGRGVYDVTILAGITSQKYCDVGVAEVEFLTELEKKVNSA